MKGVGGTYRLEDSLFCKEWEVSISHTSESLDRPVIWPQEIPSVKWAHQQEVNSQAGGKAHGLIAQHESPGGNQKTG